MNPFREVIALVQKVEAIAQDFGEKLAAHDRKVDDQLDRLEQILLEDRRNRREFRS